MDILVNRHNDDGKATISTIYIDGVRECVGLEDVGRDVKIKHETRIPAGKYNIALRTIGGFHAKYSKKFPEFHKGMLWVKDVPNYEHILIHIGNWAKNTSGCLLTGTTANSSPFNSIGNSTNAYINFYNKVVNAALDGNLTIQYIDND